MKKLFTFYIALLTALQVVEAPVFGQSPSPLTKRDDDNITYYARERLTLLNQLMNQLTDKELEGRDVNYLISNSYQPGENQVFYNDLVTIEDDINPDHTSTDKTEDVTIEKYLTDLSLFYAKPDQPNTIIFSNYRFPPARQEKDFILKKVYFTSTFRGKNTKTDKAYLPTNRVVEMRAERINNKWQVRIIRFGFFQPGESMESIPQNPASPKPGNTTTAEITKVMIPENLSINGADVAYQRTDDGVEVKLKFNRDWTQVVQAGSVDIPIGWYKRQGKLPIYVWVKGDQLDEQTKIEFQKNNNRFIFYKGLTYNGFDRVIQKPVAATTQPVGTTASSIPTSSLTLPSSQTTAIASRPPATEPKPAVLSGSNPSETQPAPTTTQISKAELKSDTPIPNQPASITTDAAVAQEKTRPSTPIVKVPDKQETSTPTLTQSLTAEAKARKARYRRAGWLQIVGGIAGLVGGYLSYSAIKKDYDNYKARVDQLNNNYNTWRDLTRNPTGSSLEPMSISSYGKPGMYGAYAGCAVSLALVVNSIRSFGKAGKIKPLIKK
ncbi:hypothetical protein DYU11_08960 [Fibrisoma montanum]|uniref:Uncharacterized protein n=1 Tax=Fibrisoma montanum TaxID=2305895 RepID=A0A418MF96_9BACT|nr:hypothetical protein [Fibrisoma montanum]RIV25417.1 hypothetical protein DYU11_08960 [Fibrisoma montanum]